MQLDVYNSQKTQEVMLVALPTELMARNKTYYLNIKIGWASWIRTNAWRSQSPLPYRLAIAQQYGGPDRDRTGDLLRDRQAC